MKVNEARSIVDPGAEIAEDVVIGDFCIIRKGAKIGPGVRIGHYCEIRENVVVGPGASFGSRCTISAYGVIGENAVIKYGFVLTDTPDLRDGGRKSVGSVGANALIGANVCLMPGCHIGDGAVIGACSQVRCDVPAGETWYGNPARKAQR